MKIKTAGDEKMEQRVWGIHTQDDALFLEKNVIAIGWEAFGDMTDMENDREAFKARYTDVYGDQYWYR